MVSQEIIKKVDSSIKEFNKMIMKQSLKTKENNDFAISLGYTIEHNNRIGYSYRKKREGRTLIIWSTRKGFVAAELFDEDGTFKNHKEYLHLGNALKHNAYPKDTIGENYVKR